MPANPASLIGALLGAVFSIKLVEAAAKSWLCDRRKQQRKQYYNEYYLDSEQWQRKRALVLKRDRFKCVFCGARATQVHHNRYARKNLGREPIE